ncbi:hypothetical protein LUZ60_009293 [Juncus effusus]|nr:hypothetical protein LUZ60_009293 [Juncus effusus]
MGFFCRLHSLPLSTLLISSFLFSLNGVIATSLAPCPPDQSSALLQLKKGFASSNLSSWKPGTNCCLWEGVSCEETTGKINLLDLNNRNIAGNLSHAIFNLTSLKYLNLAYNDFSQSGIPDGFEKLTKLTYLNMSYSSFVGQIPIGIANLTNLVSLDLSGDHSSLKLQKPSLRTLIRNLSNLKELYLDYVYISNDGTKWSAALAESVPRLQVLSLVDCALSGSFAPSFSQLSSLTHIFLEGNSLNGHFPEKIFQIQTLTSLDLSSNSELSGTFPDFPLKGSLENLELDKTIFFGEIPQSIGNLKNLTMFSASSCNFTGPVPSSLGKLTNLVHLDLSNNTFSGPIPKSLFSLPFLEVLVLSTNKFSGLLELEESQISSSSLMFIDLKENQLSGPIPHSVLGLTSLVYLYLNANQFNGSIPHLNWGISSLQLLDLSSNHLSGPIPVSIFRLPNLGILNVSSNYLNGTFELSLIHDMRNTPVSIDLSYNQLSIADVSSVELLNSFPQVSGLGLASCNLSQIPRVLQYLNDMQYLDLSNNFLSGAIPSWIWERFNYYVPGSQLYLSHNMFTRVENVQSSLLAFQEVDLSFNKIQGMVPLAVNAESFDYSNNELSYFPTNLTSSYWRGLVTIRLSGNKLAGDIPHSICNARSLQLLDLSYNNLSGLIPSCLAEHSDYLQVLNLKDNRFHGLLPDDIIGNCSLHTIDLSDNTLEGPLPRSLSRCKSLELLDFGNNRFVDTFPFWLGNLSELQVLILRSNYFHGSLDYSVSLKMNHYFEKLHILDMALNNFTGVLPQEWFENFKSMMNKSIDSRLIKAFEFLNVYYQESITVISKGQKITIEKSLIALSVLDISKNNFHGQIPKTIGNLSSLQVLNMSNNNFSEEIPTEFQHLTQLESLDLSWNQLSGPIPQELTSLTFLSKLNLSYNHLEGEIPQASQFQTFDDSSYEGNTGLCGTPLTKQCGARGVTHNETPYLGDNNGFWNDKSAIIILFLFVGLGFGVGFALVIVLQVISKRKRQIGRATTRQ